VNDYWLKTLGYERNEVIGRKVTDFYSTASRKYAEEVALPAFFRDGSVKDISYQFIKKNGEVVDVLLSANAERDDAGNVVRSQAVIENITERKKVDEALKENLAQFRALVEQSITGINVLQNGVLVYVNSRMAEIFGYQPEEMIGKSPLDFVVEADREMVRESIRRRMSGDTTSEQFIVRIMHKDGTERTLELYSIAITYKGGHAFMSTVLDITERKKAEERLRQHEAYLHGILQSTADGILAVDNNSNTITANKRFAELWKIPQNIIDTGDDDMMLHFVLSQLIDPIAFLDKIKALYGSDELGMDTLLFKDGRIFERYSAPLLQQGTRMGRVWSFRDVTERRKLEEQLRQAQKMEAIGTLAGGIAHDFNNLLQGVFGYISLARLKRDDRDKSMDALEEAEKALHMSVKLTNQLLTFSKGGKPVKRLIDLRPVIENSTKFSLSGSRSDYRIVDDDDLWQAEADEGQISQVIQNIVLNADQAMPEGGRLEITARNVHVPGNNLPQGLQEGKYVEIAIKDSGIGIREQYLEKVFDPYFTTKEKGSGLGLATSYSIIKNHDGLINVKSEPGTGTTFFIYIPATGEPHKADVQKSEPATYACQPCRVLVMDDEQMIRDVAGELLKALGHEVEFAGRGEDTIVKYRMAKQAEKPFDVVILDLTIRGGMGGAETIQKLLALDPDVKAIVSSGYSDDAALSNYREQGFRAFLKKPYNLENLRRTLNSLLA
jgi:two-component system cell cycle sensor histidine kinase/response regulator CckA